MGSAAEVPVVISSDEEDGPQTPAAGKRKSPDAAALAWAEAILDQEDSDDAVLERVGYPATMLEILDSLKAETGIVVGDEGVVGAKNTSTVPVARGNDDDDDCVILDGDPDKPVAVAKEEGGPSRDAAEDELQIVAEKGEIACRDFPHPRHLCATLPFSTSSHASHCRMCHCYVCDCHAPCPFWDNHCHATDKDSKWKRLRESKNKSQPNPKRRIPQHFNRSVTTGPSSQYSVNVTGFTLPRTIPSYGSKGAQVAPPLYTSSNGNHLQPSVSSYGLVQPARPHASQPAQVSPVGHVSAETFQRYPPQFPVGAPMGSQGHQYRPLSYPQLAPNTVVGTGVPLSRCSLLNTQAHGTQRPQVPSPGILSKESLANLAHQLGLSDYNTNQPLGQQSTSTPQYMHMHPRDILLAQDIKLIRTTLDLSQKAEKGI
ncbi:unnamed protein product [Miscanthus lutarioriparius]|uniref:RPM1 interacting protein 13 n=1 Tax=Miscanthus lutarioriparius TaxID=422564 RepID=A0A811M8D5_9POAL|nr:unnamed protein product [Miscanthus lutarioriparius]